MGVHIDALNSGGSEYVAAVERIKQIIGLRPRTPLYWYDPVFYKTAAGKQVHSDIEHTHSFTNQVRSGARGQGVSYCHLSHTSGRMSLKL